MSHVFDEVADMRLAALVALNLKNNNVFKGFPHEDIASILATHLFTKCGEYDPEKSNWESYARMVMNHRGRDLIDEMETVNARGWRKLVTASLDAVAGEDDGGDPLTLANITSDGRPDEAGEVRYKIDREAALSSLSEEQRKVADHLERGTKTIVEMAREKGIPRSTFRYQTSDPVIRTLLSIAQ